MNPIISIGLYLASQVLLLSMANRALGNAIGERVFHNRRWLKILIAVVYMLLALLPVAGALLHDSAVKFSLQKLSYHSLTYNSNVLWNRLQQSSQGFSPRI